MGLYKELLEMKYGPDFSADNTNPRLAKQVKLAVQKGGKPGDVPKYEPVSDEKINSTEFPRAKKNGWLEKELADNPGHETNMYLTKGFLEAADVFDGPEQECYPIDPLVDRDCVILDGRCNCERIQGVLNCKYNTF